MLIGFTLLPYWLSVTKCRSLFILSNIHPNIRLSLGRYIIHINSNTRLSIGFYDVHVKCVNSIIIQQFIQHYEIYISRYSVQYPLTTLAYVVRVDLNIKLSMGFYIVHFQCVNSIIIKHLLQLYEIYISKYSVQYTLTTIA